ncbi:MAG: pyridoxamine 5'-phosphate oxidase family protein [Geobacter sp.]|nr:MAG: pyridoxamine 5'-phosphate oxidase family protein [Geobacter sp.]
MLTEEIRRFIAGNPLAFVASTDSTGNPHLATGCEVRVLDAEHLAFENWFCQTTLRNLGDNPQVAVAVMALDSRTGYQFIGKVAHAFDAAILDGYAPGAEPPDIPQTLTRFVIRVEKVLAFCSGIHTDLPLPE